VAEKSAMENLLNSVGDYVATRISTPRESKPTPEESEQEKGGLLSRMKAGGKAGAVKGAVKGAVQAIKPGGKKTKRPTNIVEELWVGVDIDTCWDEWLKYEDFPGYMKGPVKVNLEDDEDDGTIVNWTAKIFLSTRSWKSTVVEQVDYERIRWESEGDKGVVEGVITFTPMGDNATLMLVVIEYHGKGPIEWIGNRWRTVGRRIRLDLKHFRRHVMMLEQSEEDSDESDEQPENGEPEGEPEEGEPEQSNG